jgi:alkanesulfonate monooxygenase SsuD/methylene tetrahydromethanopterin reductase-like flavin-dependent oxidoreductase (luciferase family)
MRAVSDEMVLTLSAAGTADDVAARISALLKAGLKQAVLFPLAVDDDASGAILRTIEALSCMTEAILSGMRSRDRARNHAYPVNAQRS